ncbi:MAG: hypothetical protein IJ466_03215 [Clostridia bacterium]|nr:hypothetical protein [Clostridia bacterium]
MKGYDRELIEKLIGTLERVQLERYVQYMSSRSRLIWTSILTGILRGLGFSIGFTVLGAGLIVLLKRLVENNMPQISGFIAEVIHAIEARM